MDSRYFALPKVLVKLGHLRKKVSKVSGNNVVLNLKIRCYWKNDVTDEETYINISTSNILLSKYLQKHMIRKLHEVATLYRNFFNLASD